MKILVTAALLLALASPAHAETEICTGRVKINVVTDNGGLNPKGTKEFSVGGCVFEGSARQKRVLRTCSLGSRCRVEGTPDGDATIETIVSVIKAPAEEEWFLILDVWTCSTRSCAEPADGLYEDLVVNETFATRKQCHAKGRRLLWVYNNPNPAETYRSTKDENLLYDVVNGDTLGMPIAGFHPRCVQHR